MTRIVAMGGGELATGETRPLDRHAVTLARGGRPRALFVPTASGDAAGYCETFREAYGDLGCATDVLRLVGDPDPPETRARKVARADLAYVGGGDTAFMLERWRETGVDDLLRGAADDTVLAGLSAGALAWFGEGLGESPPAADDALRRVDGLGLLPGSVVSHVDDPAWRSTVLDALAVGEAVVGVEANAALSVTGDRYRVVSAAPDAGAYRLVGGPEPSATPLPPRGDLDSLPGGRTALTGDRRPRPGMCNSL